MVSLSSGLKRQTFLSGQTNTKLGNTCFNHLSDLVSVLLPGSLAAVPGIVRYLRYVCMVKVRH